jgi:hypothetical protein
MASEIFRKKSLDRISSPEDLNDYLRVTNPSIWVILIAVICFLVGLIVWASTGEITTRVRTDVIVDGDYATAVFSGANIGKVQEGMTMEIGTFETTIDLSYIDPDDGNLYVYAPTHDIPNGKYEASVITERITPISFLFNNEQ